MKRRLTITFFLFIFLWSAVAFSAEKNFRCGHRLVSVGCTKQDVLIKCGEPTAWEIAGAKKDKNWGKDYWLKMEVWYYNCGYGNFIYTLTFEGHTLTKIERGGRGYGTSDCLGRELRNKDVERQKREEGIEKTIIILEQSKTPPPARR